MTVETDTPLYWKASVLDRFDGYAWERATPGDPAAVSEIQARAAALGAGLEQRHPAWITDASFELRALTSDLVIGAGTTEAVNGIDGTLASPDGTLTRAGEPLERGDQYSIVSYVPQPTPGQLRRAPVAESTRRFGGSTLLGVPPATLGAPTDQPVSMPLWGKPDSEATARLLDSPYGETYRLAREWTAGARTPYDAVRAIEGKLRARLRLHTERARAHLPALVLSVHRRRRLLPAVRRHDGADAEDGRDPVPRRLGVRAGLARQDHRGLRGARLRRPLLGRGLLPGHRLGHVRSHPRRRSGRVAAARRRVRHRFPRRGPESGRRAGHRRRSRR